VFYPVSVSIVTSANPCRQGHTPHIILSLLLGYHPWFTHWIALLPVSSKEVHYRQLFQISTKDESDAFEKLLPTLPDPITLDAVLLDLRHNLESFPLAMLGEVGLDRSFRVPLDYFASPRELTPFTIPMEHQLAILEAQLTVAVEFGRNVSFHSVKSPTDTMQLFKRMSKTYAEKWENINIDMHSCGFSSQSWEDMEVTLLLMLTCCTDILLMLEKPFKCLLISLHHHQRPVS